MRGFEIIGHLVESGLIPRNEDEIVMTRREDLRQFMSNAGGCAGDKRPFFHTG